MRRVIASKLSQSLPSVLPTLSLPSCANRFCRRPPTLWQRWWARHEGIRLEADWFCSPECFVTGVERKLESELRSAGVGHAPRHRLPLGLILVEQGRATPEQLQMALRQQRLTRRGRIGEWLVKLGAVCPQEVIEALAVQQNCPVFRHPVVPTFPDGMRFPLPLIRHCGGVPVYFNATANCLYLGFCGPLHRPLLAAAERLLGCQVEPCIVTEASYQRAVEHWEASSQGEAIVFGPGQREMVRTICGYAEQTSASACALTRCQDYLWARLSGDVGSLDLLFRCGREPATELMDPVLAGEFELQTALV